MENTRSIHEEWEEFRRACLSQELSSASIKYLRRVFYAGVMSGCVLYRANGDDFFERRLQRELSMFFEDATDGRL